MAGGRPGALVVLGVFFAHRHPALLRAAARRGLAVLGVDKMDRTTTGADAARRRDPDHPLAGLADVAWLPCDRGPAVLERVLAWSREYDVRAVAVLGEDFVEAGGLVADCLGLRGPGLRASRVCRNKLLQRRFLAAWSPRSRLVPADARAAVTADWDLYPAVVKPVSRTASSGVRRVHSLADLRTALDGFGSAEPALIEDLVTGPELSVESLVRGGRVLYASLTGKRTNEGDGTWFVEMGHTVPAPALSEDTTAAVLAANAGVLTRLGFADGAAHAEFRVGPTGRVTLMEIAARPAGDAIPGLCHLATGAPLEETLLAILLGEAVDGHPAPRRFARQVFVPHEAGVLRAVRADGLDVEVCDVTRGWAWPDFVPVAADAPGRVAMVVASRPPGSVLGPVRESVERCVSFVVDAPSLAELDRLQARCLAAVRVEVEVETEVEAQVQTEVAFGAGVGVRDIRNHPFTPAVLARRAARSGDETSAVGDPGIEPLVPAELLLGDPQAGAMTGRTALVVSEPPCPPDAADHLGLAPIRLAEIIDAAASWSQRFAIRAVRAFDSRYLDAAALIGDLLGLPSPGLRAARVCGDMTVQRLYLAPWICRCNGELEHTVISTSADGELREIATGQPALAEIHTAILKHLGFLTGTARADYHLSPGCPPDLVRLTILP